jgi:hypothetical protein
LLSSNWHFVKPLTEALHSKLWHGIHRIGEEFLVMLPETITFIHELLEDGEEDVEEEMRTTVKVIEGLLGESLQEYLN